METNPKTVFKSAYDVEYSFKIRRVASGNFKNLWRLDIKVNDEPTEMLIDADDLSTVLARMSYVFEQDGY